MSTIEINGRMYAGSSLSIKGNKILIDGAEIEQEDAKIFNINVVGDIDQLSADVCKVIHISGDVTTVTSISGDIECGDVGMSVSTVSGDVRVAGQVGGSISTVSGDILHR